MRHGSSTDAPTAADIARLTARASAVTSRLALRVKFDTTRLMVISDRVLSDEARDAFMEAEVNDLHRTLPAPSVHRLDLIMDRDTRSRDEFLDEVDEYARAVRDQWPAIVVADHIEHERSRLVSVVVNDTDDNFEEVVLELTIPLDRRLVHARSRQAKALLRPPEPPSGWGGFLWSALRGIEATSRSAPPPAPEFEEPEKGTTLVRFPGLHVRPHTPHLLAPLFLALFPKLAGTTLSVRWRVTARNTSGQLEDEVDLVVPGLDRATEIGPQPSRER